MQRGAYPKTNSRRPQAGGFHRFDDFRKGCIHEAEVPMQVGLRGKERTHQRTAINKKESLNKNVYTYIYIYIYIYLFFVCIDMIHVYV